MLAGRSGSPRVLSVLLAFAACVLFLWVLRSDRFSTTITRAEHPLIKQHITNGEGAGGRWYIPPKWLNNTKGGLRMSTDPLTLLDAAELALELALHNSAFIVNTKIPLLVHQTLSGLETAGWPLEAKESVEDWLELATGARDPAAPQMAYFFWDDGGVDALVETYEPRLWTAFQKLHYNIERADVFRVTALRWFGGVYADVDVKPLQHPSMWVQENDLADWTEPTGAVFHRMHHPFHESYEEPDIAPYNWRNLMAGVDTSHLAGIGAIFGIECDSDPAKDEYWRLGYSHPVQVTNWALAMAPTHPVTGLYLDQVAEQIRANEKSLPTMNPLDLTGAPALTLALQNHTEHDKVEQPTSWNSLSGRQDPAGGRGKVLAGDVLVLPITAFSPGRGYFHNMGSQPVTHPTARLFHSAAGSWRKADLKVHAGELCRKYFGRCKEWATIPESSAMPLVSEALHEAEAS